MSKAEALAEAERLGVKVAVRWTLPRILEAIRAAETETAAA
jgi:hypothetical protein